MRRLTIFFAVLDVGILMTYAVRVPGYFTGLSHQPVLNLICLLVTAAIAASVYGLFRGHLWAFTLNYVLFPFRFMLAFLSLIWLALLILPPQPSVRLSEAVYGVAFAFEGLRLGLTIMLHVEGRRQQRNHLGGFDVRPTQQPHNQPMQRTAPAV